MKMIMPVVMSLIAAWVAPAYAAEYDVTTVSGEAWGMKTLTLTNAQIVTSSSLAADGLSAEVPAPIFHFDASDTNGWEFTVEDGKTFVTKIPSKTGNGRHLTSEQPAKPTMGWTITSGPEYVTDVAALNGGAMIDFGVQGSRRGLVFDADAANASSNGLFGIGSIVAVYGSERGGGWILGGGYGWNETSDNYFVQGFLWHRGAHPYMVAGTEKDGTPMSFANPMIRHPGLMAVVRGKAWQDGFEVIPTTTGFSGGWQTLSMVFTNVTGQATGVGVNDSRNGQPARSDGQQIAEMLFFGTRLTNDQRRSVEAYLMKKWFGRNRVGYNSRADLSEISMLDSANYPTADYATAEIAEDEVLSVGRLTGGLRGGALTKKGAGTLSICDAAAYPGAIRVQEGTLRFPCRACPDSLPTNSLLHLDASLPETFDLVEENGTQFVAAWRDVEGRDFLETNRMMAAATAEHRPIFRANMLNGAPVVDFGAYTDVDGKFLESPKELPGIATVFLVIGVQEGGGNLLGANGISFFSRKNWSGASHSSGLWNYDAKDPSYGTLNMANGKTFVDGVEVDPDKGFPHRGYHVVAARVPGVRVKYLARAGNGTKRGGQRLAEVVLYNRVLTEREMADAQAYLMRKWLQRDAPGYRSELSDNRPDVQNLEMADGTVIETEGQGTVIAQNLKARGTIVKRGEGTLVVEAGSLENLVVEGGAVENRARPLANEDGPADGPVFHLDATRLDTMLFRPDGGTNFVRQWHDTAGRNVAGEYDSAADRPLPWLRPASEANANGHPVMDFGVRGSARAFAFDQPVNTLRAAYILIGTQDAYGGFLLGSLGKWGNRFDFHRGGDDALDDPARQVLLWNDVTAPVRDGEIFIDGVRTNYTAGLNGGYQLVEIHPTAAAHVSALACDRWWGGKTPGTSSENARRTGGQRLGEVLLYDRVLTERERVATRNYLMRKWLGREPQELPAEEIEPIHLSSTMVEGDITLNGDLPISVVSVEGKGMLTKGGTNVLSIADTSAYTGTVAVTSGTLTLNGEPLPDFPEGIPAGATFHVDATTGLICTTNASGEISVTRWDNLASAHAGWSVVPAINAPTLLEGELNWLPVVDMGKMGANKYLKFRNANGEYDRVKHIRAIFWVIGSQDGGGYLMGGGTNSSRTVEDIVKYDIHYNFHRGVTPGTNDIVGTITHENKLIGHSADPAIKSANATWHLNGEQVDPFQVGLSGGYDLLSMVITNGTHHTEAEGFAFDGRSNYGGRGSGQRLGEVIIYDRVLSDAERRQVEFYLSRKWGLVSRFRASEVSSADFVVADGATLTLGGTNQPVRSVCGTGTIRDGRLEVQGGISAGMDAATPGTLTLDADLALGADSVWAIDLAADAVDKIVVNGTCTFADPQKVVLNNIDAVPNQQEYAQVVMEADAFANADALQNAVFLTEIPRGKAVSLSVRDNQVLLKFSKLGLCIIVR